MSRMDWLEYTVHVSKNDKYYVKVRTRGLEEKNHFTIDVNTQTMSGLLQINASEEFQSIETREVFVSEGDRIFVKQGIIDLNWFEILKK